MVLTLFERPKCLLAKDACKSQRSYILIVNFHLASCLCLGWGTATIEWIHCSTGMTFRSWRWNFKTDHLYELGIRGDAIIVSRVNTTTAHDSCASSVPFDPPTLIQEDDPIRKKHPKSSAYERATGHMPTFTWKRMQHVAKGSGSIGSGTWDAGKTTWKCHEPCWWLLILTEWHAYSLIGV